MDLELTNRKQSTTVSIYRATMVDHDPITRNALTGMATMQRLYKNRGIYRNTCKASTTSNRIRDIGWWKLMKVYLI